MGAERADGLRAPGAILLVACYELGHQPLAVAWPAAALEARGFAPAVLDVSVEPFDPERAAAARVVAISVPMHTALRLGVTVGERVRAVSPGARIVFYGLYAHLNAGIYSWWGRDGYPPTDDRFDRYLAAARTTPFRWAIYYEREGYANPSVETIRSDLEYIRDKYAWQPAYLKIDGRFVVYVYGNSEDSCDATATRWRKANTVGAYVVLKAFDGFRSCPAQPDAWHQYSAALPEYDLAPDAFMIAPGFDEWSEGGPRLARDLARWRADVTAMVASNAHWQLVLTFNEWPEGTSVESAHEWASPSGYGAYLDALHELVLDM